MKILATGDFHGEFPKKFKSLIKKEKIDLVISNGDYFPFHYRDLWFKHCYQKETELWEVIGKEKYKKLILKDLKDGESAIKKLNALPIPVFTVVGNIDYTRKSDVTDTKVNKKHYWAWNEQDFFSPIIKKYPNIKRFDYSYLKFQDYIFIEAYGGSGPGKVKSKAYKKSKKILDSFFNKFKNEKIIFVSHNVPYNTKLDKIGQKAHKKVKGKHYGSKLVKRVIEKYHPLIHIGGHIHEGRGLDKVGKTLCVNPGSAHDLQAAIISIPDKDKVKVKFIKYKTNHQE